MTSTIEIFFSNLIGGLPQIAVAAVGLILIQTRLKRVHPRAYRYGSIGFVLLLASAIWGVFGRTYFLAASAAEPLNRVALANSITMVGLVGSIGLIAALIFILVAVLADRDAASSSGVAAEPGR